MSKKIKIFFIMAVFYLLCTIALVLWKNPITIILALISAIVLVAFVIVNDHKDIKQQEKVIHDKVYGKVKDLQ